MTGEVEPHPFQPLAEHMGRAYLRYAFTKGTSQEVEFMFNTGVVAHGSRVLDVGCGPGRHSIELASRGCSVHGVDISARFIEIAREEARDLNATFEVGDASKMRFSNEFDSVICVCQGAFGMNARDNLDRSILEGIGRALKPGGRLMLTAFNAYFSVRYHADAKFDAGSGCSTEETVVLDEKGAELKADLVTGCYTPRELRLLAELSGLDVVSIFGGEPGRYMEQPPSVDLPEIILLATKRC